MSNKNSSKIPKKTRALIDAWIKFINDNDIDIETDNYGQIVIYTGLMFDKDGSVVPFQDLEEENR
jgi:hypothetical protein